MAYNVSRGFGQYEFVIGKFDGYKKSISFGARDYEDEGEIMNKRNWYVKVD